MTRLAASLISIVKRLAALGARRRIARDVDDELAFHLAMKEAAARDAASDAAIDPAFDPALDARRRLGNRTLYQEQTREMWTFPSIESILQDVRYALRTLRRAPGFSLVAIMALAIGIGANTAIYSLAHAVLFEGLPYRDADRLVLLIGNVERQQVERRGNSYPDHLDWRAGAESFEDIGAYSDMTVALRSIAEPERLPAEAVTPSYFSVLGVTPALGRTFREDENAVEDRDAVVILGDGLWRQSFGADPAVLNRTVTLGARAYTVVGVMPPGFTGLSDNAALWIPFAMGGIGFDQRGDRGFYSIARLKPGVTVAAAQTEMTTISARLAAAYPDSNDKRSVEVTPLALEVFGALRRPVYALMAAVVFVLLIACANVANLMVTRADVRAREMALRTALGAGQRRLIRQLITEGLVLAMAGALCGVALAAIALRVLVASSPIELPSFSHPSIHPAVLLFTTALTMATGVLLGLAPAMHSRIHALTEALKSGNRNATGSSRRLRSLLVVVEVALTVVLLVGAGLMIRTVQHLGAIAPGFDPNGVLTENLVIPPKAVGWQTIVDRVRAVPGVASAALATDIPLAGGSSAVFYAAEGDSTSGAQRAPRAYIHRVSPMFFETLEIPLRAGRTFTPGESTPDGTAVVVSEALARRFWASQGALGRRIKIGGAASSNPWLTIIGIVPDLKYRGLPENPTTDPDIFLPMVDRGQLGLVVRTSQSPMALAPAVRAAVRDTSNQIIVFGVHPLDEFVRDQTATSRFTTWLLSAFAGAALVLAMIGLYGVMSYLVEQRTREFGIRLALGARPSSIVALVLREGGVMIAIGLVIGGVAARQLAHLLEAQLVGVTAADPSGLAAVALLALVAAAACVVPAWRATRVAPVIALRNS